MIPSSAVRPPVKPVRVGAPITESASPKTIPAPRTEPLPVAPTIKLEAISAEAASEPGRSGGNETQADKKSEPKPAAEKTFSDKEIMASVPPDGRKRVETKSAPKPKVSRATPPNQTRLWMSLGEEMGVVPIDIVNTVAGETGLPGKVVGTVDIRERHLFVDVASEHANSIIAKLNRTQIKGHKVKVKVA